jgi:aminoglycoside phosphotransferase (APT) family kinase protein
MQAEMGAILRRDGVIHDPAARITPLTGGVSSEIYRVEDGGKVFAVKRALAKLKVADDWQVDLGRNAAEVDYLTCVGGLLPGAVPAVLSVSRTDHYFVMEFLGDGFANWKTLLLDGVAEPDHARQAARVLATIHRRTWDDAEVRAKFETTSNFIQLRLDPYLATTGRRHPVLESHFAAEIERILAARRCLIHGDYSPKNLLLGHGRLVVLDCEVAWFGDPTFDAAFLLNHFFLKSLHLDQKRDAFLALVEAFHETYAEELGAEKWALIAPHLPRLLLMLMLARVDGKSPVEYLREDEPKKNLLRRFAGARIPSPPRELPALLADWKKATTL